MVRPRSGGDHRSVGLVESGQNAAQGEVVEVAVVSYVLHVPSPVGGEGVHERVALSVEFDRWHAESFA